MRYAKTMKKLVIIGGGMIGALEAYFAYREAKGSIEISIYDKGHSTNTACHIFPSLTPDEILAVVPRGKELTDKLSLLFSEPEGIRIDDVPHVNDSKATLDFIEAVHLYGDDPAHDDRTVQLLEMGKLSLQLWHTLYMQDDLKPILDASHYKEGYRIDLIYDRPDAKKMALEMQNTYIALGYDQCKLLSPKEVTTIDPFLSDFCQAYTASDGSWKNSCCAIWRPGGSLKTSLFLPKLYAYLKKQMGPRLTLELGKEVTGVLIDANEQIVGLKFNDQSIDIEADFHFCPGEAVGTLSRFGFDEPPYAAFAGPSLSLTIPLDPPHTFAALNHSMEVHKIGICLTWHAHFDESHITIGVAGTKAFYGQEVPHIDHAFALNRHLVQLGIINEVLPELVSLACGFRTHGKTLTQDDLISLEQRGWLKRWVGRRAVAYDGFPTLGPLYRQGNKIKNGRCTTHLGSGGVAFAPAAVLMSRQCEEELSDLARQVLHYADSRRRPKRN
jgi:hypothetical protein